jgi:hypothetical protein
MGNAKLARPLLPGLPNWFYAADLWRYWAYGQSGFSGLKSLAPPI